MECVYVMIKHNVNKIISLVSQNVCKRRRVLRTLQIGLYLISLIRHLVFIYIIKRVFRIFCVWFSLVVTISRTLDYILVGWTVRKESNGIFFLIIYFVHGWGQHGRRVRRFFFSLHIFSSIINIAFCISKGVISNSRSWLRARERDASNARLMCHVITKLASPTYLSLTMFIGKLVIFK